jgi:ribosomal-protein-alanine N-acetyltransferase
MSSAEVAPGRASPQRLVRFRAMTPFDVAGVAAVERSSYPFPWSEGIFRDCLRVGEAHVLNLCVNEAMRGRGVGRQMLKLLVERSAQAGMQDVFLEVRPSNMHAIALYQSVGFIEVGRRRGYYQAVEGREDALVLKLSIPVKSQG